ncbi:MAG: hypothetical protein KBT10_00360 [Bacteroidales bacterium]|nr:hypothetical protein [Candidatus Sodaliphilus aphodohippi]
MMGEFRRGRLFFSLEFFKSYAIYIIIAIVMLLMNISNKYTYENYCHELMKLKIELGNAKTDLVNSSAKYNSMIRESHMKEYIDTMRIDLTNPEEPPYQLSLK